MAAAAAGAEAASSQEQQPQPQPERQQPEQPAQAEQPAQPQEQQELRQQEDEQSAPVVDVVRALASDLEVLTEAAAARHLDSDEDAADPEVFSGCVGGRAPRRCRPASVEDFHRRLTTFRTPWWFAKPAGISPIDCARRGWTCVGQDTLACECCDEEMSMMRSAEGWLVSGVPLPPAKGDWLPAPGEPQLVEGHSPFCPWRSHEATCLHPAKMSEREIFDAVERRAAGLRAALAGDAAEALCLPSLAGEGEEEECPEDVCEALARAGWEHARRGDLDLLRCAYCLRLVAVQSFAHRRLCEEENGKPAAKRARLSPRPGLWTPRARAAAPGPAEDEDTAAEMDPFALHRFYCPMFSRPPDDLSPMASRTVRIRETMAIRKEASEVIAAAARGEAAKDLDVESAKALAAAGAGQAAARAAEVLRSLYSVLPQPT